MNYSDIARRRSGVSTDNFYYFDGINVTDPVTGTFGANLNTEIIQEQKVITGGIPAEYVGAPGLISNVITKSGSNSFHGSVNYFFQNDDLVAENKNSPTQEFSTYDTAFTLGGPIVQGQGLVLRQLPLHRTATDDVTTLDTQPVPAHRGQHRRTRASPRAPGRRRSNDTFSFTFLNDPTEITGRRDRDITNARDRTREQGGNRYSANYTRILGNTAARRSATTSTTARSPTSRRSARRATRSLFRGTDARTLTDEQLGGFGRDLLDHRDDEGSSARALQLGSDRTRSRPASSGAATRELPRHALHRTPTAPYTSTGRQLSGVTAGEHRRRQLVERQFNVDQRQRLQRLHQHHQRPAEPRRVLHRVRHQRRRHDHPGRARRARWSSTARPATRRHGQLLPDLPVGARAAGRPSRSGLSFFVQDEFTLEPLDLQRSACAPSSGSTSPRPATSIFTFDWTFAPRLSAVYDVTRRRPAEGRRPTAAATTTRSATT